jgi:hypothetical protein
MDQVDRRLHVRRPLVAEARLRHLSGALTPCTLQNISDTGAMISLDEDVELPKQFLFEISGNLVIGRLSRLVWHEGRLAGMEFVARRKRRRATG